MSATIVAAQDVHDFRCLGCFHTFVGRYGLAGLQDLQLYGKIRFGQQLAQEARHFVFVQSVGSDVVHECDTFRTLHKTVKIERVHGYFMLYGGQSEHLPQVIGDERSVVHGFGQHPFVDGEHQDMPEIQVTRLQYAHDL